MLADNPTHAILPTSDLDSLRRFYEDTLGFKVKLESPAAIQYGAGNGTYFAIARSSGKASGDHTQISFSVSDIEAEVADLRSRGVDFLEYEVPKTVNGIADVGAGRAAWFKDPDGNLIGIIQFN